ncbi:DUF4258 domain-containing protein [Streptomyces xinghaiensis]|uniref:DUF4258 domain-containing protein n=3 Tax=Streptomyces TaxID=1883 RepID=A0A3M8FE60_9ACTN|nr:hypothetical protein BEN35_02350 [Streptomyces fradiae]PQM24810.1 DUF4258 domain-containing protein [Streptomyces xinghaiensis]RKM98862.1 DUF4258 domain-containing protein [Streptomyces xinghaiensis]RNC76236.1 DUF4258 domain-containing protein [Streptomyces xinghaiensis]
MARILVAGCTAGSVLMTTALAQADTRTPSADRVAQAVETVERVTGTADLVAGTTMGDGATRAEVPADAHAARIIVPATASGSVESAYGDDVVRLGLPGATDAPAAAGANGTVVYADADDDFDLVVQPNRDGVRTLITLRDADAPTEYRFPLDLPADAVTEQLEDGSILVSQGEEYLGTFDAPWAKDANGEAVPTDYRIEGGALVQTVRTGPNTAYPVVADPAWFIPLAIVAGRLLLTTGVKSISRHAAQRMAQRGISQQMVANAVKHGKKSRGKTAGTWKYTSGKIWVVVNKNGNVVSVGRN